MRTLVGWRQKETGFPSLPGVRYPQVIQQPHALDFGKEFEGKGVKRLSVAYAPLQRA